MFISNRYFFKLAGEKEAKFITGINFDFAKNKLIESGNSSPTPAEIKSYVEVNDYEMPINAEKRNLIKSKKIEINERICLNANESLLLITGSVLTSVSENEINQKIENIKWYLVFKELNPGDIEKESPFVKTDLNSIIETFNQFYSKVLELKTKADQSEKESKGNSEKNKYKTPLSDTFIKYTFKNGWKVVYIPASGEDIGEGQTMPIFEEYEGTSFDRVLEGNKMGICLGEQTRYYQNNSQGEIYSIRNLNNEPKATIRISRKSLQECKGKGNSTPSVEVCALAKEWFDNERIDYKKNEDYKKFPPLTAEDALNEFTKNTIKAYNFENRWISFWYGKGIEEIDNDVKNKIESNDPNVLVLANRFPALVQKVYEHLCLESADKNSAPQIMRINARYYTKLECTKKFLEKIAKKDPMYFMENFANNTDAKDYLPIAYYNLANIYPEQFIEKFSYNPDANVYLPIAYQSVLENDPYRIIQYINNPGSKDYIDKFILKEIEDKPLYFLENLHYYPHEKNHLEKAYANLAKKDPINFLEKYVKNKDIKNTDDKDIKNTDAKKYLQIAYKNLAEKDPYLFLKEYGDEKDAENYLEPAYEFVVEKYPESFLFYHTDKPGAYKHLNRAYESLAKKILLFS